MVTEADPHDNTAVLAKRVIVFNLQFPYVLNQINELYSLTNWSEYFQGIGIASQATLCLCSSQSIAIVFTARFKIRQILYLDGRGNKLVWFEFIEISDNPGLKRKFASRAKKLNIRLEDLVVQ